VIDVEGSRLIHVANGVVTSTDKNDLATRLLELHNGLTDVFARFNPHEAAVEHTFVNKDAGATLKLGQARAMSLLVPAQAGLPVSEYAPNQVKKSVVGAGHAAKEQIELMVGTLLPGCEIVGPDAADALAVAITHAHMGRGQNRLAEALARQKK
jgi:crossover junction endodeoxyribonuclease RuvC